LRPPEFGRGGTHLSFGFIFAQFEVMLLHINLFKGVNLISLKSENRVMTDQGQDVEEFHGKIVV
jgi:hypothetical protein